MASHKQSDIMYFSLKFFTKFNLSRLNLQNFEFPP